jgi:hypothetical protein
MTDTSTGGLVRQAPEPTRARRWRAVIGLVGLAAVVVATVTTVGDARGKALPGPWPLAAALIVQVCALIFIGRAWAALFPPEADRRTLASSLYTSQLTKYLPAGGLVQAASQVALSAHTSGVGSAALRLPVFSLCAIAAGATLAAPLVFSSSLPSWGRALAGLAWLVPLLLDRRLLGCALRAARRVVRRLPDPGSLPPQRSILTSYAFALANMATYAAGFTILLDDLTDVDPLLAGAALCAAWVVGYLVVPLPSGLGVREVVLVAALPALAAAPLLAASLAHRLLGIGAEVGLAGVTRLRLARGRHRLSA